jgi:hypothetical protein
MTEHHSNILHLISTYICDTQTSLSQHVFMVNEKHKVLKECICHLELNNKDNVSFEDKEKLRKILADLDGYLLESFGDFFERTHRYSMAYFNARSKMPPRMTLKLVAGDKLGTLLKIPDSFLSEGYVSIPENTGFDKIAKGEKHFLCNNIPEKIVGDYQNARINRDKAIEFSKINNEGREKQYEDKYDDEWAKCWKLVKRLDSDILIESPPETCYKSTIIIPISMLAKKLSKEFMSKLKILESSKRVIFGFLCFDHINVGYFNDDDINFTQIIADVLSLFLINQLMFTQFSYFYNRAQELSCS